MQTIMWYVDRASAMIDEADKALNPEKKTDRQAEAQVLALQAIAVAISDLSQAVGNIHP